MGRDYPDISVSCAPSNPLRMMNHWDNMDGSIERGYSGRSFFYANDEIIVDDRTVDYARFMASIGINGIVINNVNVKWAATDLITTRFFDKVKELSDIFEDYGIKLYLSLNFAAPIELGGLPICDPLDEQVKQWWKNKIKEVYDHLPNLGGFLVKADSEGRPGPFTYGRTQADGANMLGDIIAPYGGIIIWRCFVYNCTQDWRDTKTDRARAGYDYFKGLDGQYHDNVILQIKNGPMDFQIREPISPLLGGLTQTNQMLEVQIAQEYTGHQIDLCYLIPMFKEILGFKTYCKSDNDTVADVVSGRTMGNKLAGMAAVRVEFYSNEAVIPFENGEMDQQEFFEEAMDPFRQFMYGQTQKKDVILFMNIDGIEWDGELDSIPNVVLIPSFIVSELRTAFIIGFMIYIPFIVIDMVVASVLMSMGMMMLPPTTISLPFKILLFVLADGWSLIIGNLVKSFY